MSWSYETLNTHRTWTVEDIPPELGLLLGEPDLACLADAGELDPGLILHLAYAAAFELPRPDTVAWIEAAIESNPGVWISRLCRARHGRPENLASIARCGQCRSYSNGRKRRRAANLPPELLPGFETIGGAYQLHPPCSCRDLTWLRHRVYRLVRLGRVSKRREKIPDLRQARGWDWGSRLYPAAPEQD